MKRVLLLGITVAVVGVGSWQLLPADKRAPAGVPDVPATLPAAAPAAIQGLGYVEPVSEVRQLMMRTGGVIKKCYANVGDTVRKGDVILELEDATQRADVDLARKNLDMLQADAANVNAGINPYQIKTTEQTVERLREKFRHYRAEAARYRAMLATKAASSQDHEAMETLRRQSEVELKEQEAELERLRHYVTPENRAWQEARIKHAQANLGLAEERLRETKLLAPFDGTVLKLLKREGEGVRSFEPEAVVLFGDVTRLRVRAEIDERFVHRLAVGQGALIYSRTLAGKTYRGRVVLLEQVMGNKTVFTRASSERKDLDVLQVLIDMGPDFHVPAGLQVDVKIE
jgi:multidrug resistance efflux pump